VPGAGFPESAFLWMYLRSNQSEANDYFKKHYPPNFQYPDLASSLKAEFFSPEQWLDIFNASGAKYVVLVSKHHDGYSMWPSANSFNWNSMDVGPKRDIIGELFAAAKKKHPSMRMGLYYSLFEFYNELYLSDQKSNYTNDDYLKVKLFV
jgi:alpha-L-fucosidase